MKTALKLLALFFAIALPSAFAAEFAGINLPASLDPLHALSGFVAVLALLTVLSDYATDQAPARHRRAVTAATNKSNHPLAA